MQHAAKRQRIRKHNMGCILKTKSPSDFKRNRLGIFTISDSQINPCKENQ